MPSQKKNIMPWDVDRWRSDEAVALMGCVGRTVWREVLDVMWKLGRKGELSETWGNLAKLCRVSLAEARAGVQEIKARNVGEVRVDEGTGVVTLVCRSMQRDAKKRELTRIRVRNHRTGGGGNPVENRDVTLSVTRMKQPDAGPHPPPSSPSPRPSPPISPTSPIASQSGPAAALPVGTREKRTQRKLSAAQNAVREAFIDWWCNHGYPLAMGGVVYDFDGSADGQAVKRIMEHAAVRYSLEPAKAIATAYLTADDFWLAKQNRPLSILGKQLQTWVVQSKKTPAQQRKTENSHVRRHNERNDDGTRAGEYAEPDHGAALQRLANANAASAPALDRAQRAGGGTDAA